MCYALFLRIHRPYCTMFYENTGTSLRFVISQCFKIKSLCIVDQNANRYSYVKTTNFKGINFKRISIVTIKNYNYTHDIK